MNRFLTLSLACLFSASASAYVLLDRSWPQRETTFYLGALEDELWQEAFGEAIARWHDTAADFVIKTSDANIPKLCAPDGINNTWFDAQMCGEAWGDLVLAVTVSWAIDGDLFDTDIIFNSFWNYGVYDGHFAPPHHRLQACGGPRTGSCHRAGPHQRPGRHHVANFG